MSTEISVIMAVYNGSEYVEQAVDSILTQTFKNFEFVIIDDGSTDKTPLILSKYCDERIRIVKNPENIGLTLSLNLAIQLACGKYIARQDADDISFPDRLEKQYQFMETRPEVGLVGVTTQWIDGDGNFLQIWNTPTENPGIQETLLKYNCLIHGATMFRKSVLNELGGYDPTMTLAQDYDLWLRIADGWDIACLPDVLYQYRWHAGMLSVQKKELQEKKAFAVRMKTVKRRIRYSVLALGYKRNDIHQRMRSLSRKELADRYVWWSAGSRYNKTLALYFLLVALTFWPTSKTAFDFIMGIIHRKLGIMHS